MNLWLHTLLITLMFMFSNSALAEKILVPGTGLIAGNLKTNAFFTLEKPRTAEKAGVISINIKKEKGIKLKINRILAKRELAKIKNALRKATHQAKTKKRLTNKMLSTNHPSPKKQHKLALHKTKQRVGKVNKRIASGKRRIERKTIIV